MNGKGTRLGTTQLQYKRQQTFIHLPGICVRKAFKMELTDMIATWDGEQVVREGDLLATSADKPVCLSGV